MPITVTDPTYETYCEDSMFFGQLGDAVDLLFCPGTNAFCSFESARTACVKRIQARLRKLEEEQRQLYDALVEVSHMAKPEGIG